MLAWLARGVYCSKGGKNSGSAVRNFLYRLYMTWNETNGAATMEGWIQRPDCN